MIELDDLRVGDIVRGYNGHRYQVVGVGDKYSVREFPLGREDSGYPTKIETIEYRIPLELPPMPEPIERDIDDPRYKLAPMEWVETGEVVMCKARFAYSAADAQALADGWGQVAKRMRAREEQETS